MAIEKKPAEPREPNAVDDVRRVRERLSDEFGGDLRRLAEHAEQVTEQHRETLRLRPVASSTPPTKVGV